MFQYHVIQCMEKVVFIFCYIFVNIKRRSFVFCLGFCFVCYYYSHPQFLSGTSLSILSFLFCLSVLDASFINRVQLNFFFDLIRDPFSSHKRIVSHSHFLQKRTNFVFLNLIVLFKRFPFLILLCCFLLFFFQLLCSSFIYSLFTNDQKVITFFLLVWLCSLFDPPQEEGLGELSQISIRDCICPAQSFKTKEEEGLDLSQHRDLTDYEK